MEKGLDWIGRGDKRTTDPISEELGDMFVKGMKAVRSRRKRCEGSRDPTGEMKTEADNQQHCPKVHCPSPHRHQPEAEAEPPRLLQEVQV
jgi:hypothetical protein